MQIVIASVIEDRIQRRYYMVPFSARVKRPKGEQRGLQPKEQASNWGVQLFAAEDRF